MLDGANSRPAIYSSRFYSIHPLSCCIDRLNPSPLIYGGNTSQRLKSVAPVPRVHPIEDQIALSAVLLVDICSVSGGLAIVKHLNLREEMISRCGERDRYGKWFRRH